jgi:hypothetical protein
VTRVPPRTNVQFSHDSRKNANSCSGSSEHARVPAVALKKNVDLVTKESVVSSDSDGPPPLENDSDWSGSDSETPPRFCLLENNFRSKHYSSSTESKHCMATASSRR